MGAKQRTALDSAWNASAHSDLDSAPNSAPDSAWNASAHSCDWNAAAHSAPDSADADPSDLEVS